MSLLLIIRSVLGLAVCISSTVIASIGEMPEFEEPVSYEEIQEYVVATAARVNQVAQAILAIPYEEHTYENTLRTWNQLTIQLSQEINELQFHADAQSVDELNAFLSQILDFPYLHQTLEVCAEKLLQDNTIDVFQKYIAMRFFNKRWQEPVYFHRSAQEEMGWDANFTLLNFDPILIEEIQDDHLAQSAASANADVVYIPNIDSDEDAYAVYQALEREYAHLIYLPPNFRSCRKNGLIIASKHSLEQIQLNEIEESDHLKLPRVVRRSDRNAEYSLTLNNSSYLARDTKALNVFKIIPIKSGRDRDNDAGYSVEGRISRHWGGKNNESKWEGSISGEVRDGRGNHAEAEVKHNDKGEGSAEVRGGHESKKK